MEDNGSFNGSAFYSVFRLVLQPTLDSLLQMPEMKEPETYDWGDENGTEVYLGKRYIKPRNVSLNFLMMADDETDFWQRYKLLLNVLIAPGLIRLYIVELGRSFYVYYTKSTNAKSLTLFKQGGKVCSIITLEFIEPNPSLFEPFTYLSDKNGNKLITQLNNKIITPEQHGNT